jgi:hypothetical protein
LLELRSQPQQRLLGIRACASDDVIDETAQWQDRAHNAPWPDGVFENPILREKLAKIPGKRKVRSPWVIDDPHDPFALVGIGQAAGRQRGRDRSCRTVDRHDPRAPVLKRDDP